MEAKKRGRPRKTYLASKSSAQYEKRAQARKYLQDLAGDEESYHQLVLDLVDWSSVHNTYEEWQQELIEQLGENIRLALDSLPPKSTLRRPLIVMLSRHISAALMSELTGIPSSTIRNAKLSCQNPEEILYDSTTKVPITTQIKALF